MADYQFTASEEPCAVIRTEDGACIPPDMANRDYNGDQMRPGYIQWKESGGVPDPYVEPPPAAPGLDLAKALQEAMARIEALEAR